MVGGVLHRYREYLPITPETPLITLGEGSTPLVASDYIRKEVGCAELYFKLEGCNPTGSFKDRGMVMAVAKAIEAGSKTITCASTGNTSASAAAYGAHYGLKTIVMVPAGNIAHGKLAQAKAYGARVVQVNGNFDVALELVQRLSRLHPITLVNSVNPYRIQGQKTAAFEIVDVLGDAPDYVFIPVGNAGNITAYWKGFVEYHDMTKATRMPRMMGFQAAGAAPIVAGHPIANPNTIATAIRIGNPASWVTAVAARDQSGGTIDSVTDDEIISAYRMLASKEGVFCEPASAAPVAGLLKLVAKGLDLKGKRVVCIVTGHGLKDPDLVERTVSSDIIEVEAELGLVEEALGLK